MKVIDKHEDALLSRIANLRRDIATAEKNLNDYRANKAGVAINDIVECRGIKYKVRSIRGHYSGVEILGSPMRKDGTFGSAIRYVQSDWTKVDCATQEPK